MLTEILKAHDIQQIELAEGIKQRNGKSFSPALVSRVLKGYKPKGTPDYQQQIEQFLRSAGVPEGEIEGAWTSLTEEAQADDVSNATHEENDMSKPVLTQGAKRLLGLSSAQELFERDIQSASDLYLNDEAYYLRAHLRSTALNGGFIAVVSEAGGGKTTIANDLEEYVSNEHLDVCFIRPDYVTVERLTAAGIYDAIIDDVSEGQETPKRSIEYRSRQARRLLAESGKNGRKHVLVIEEAHALHHNTLKALKRFWEIKQGHQNLLGIVLIGQTELKARLSDSSWNVREVALRCQVVVLPPLSVADVQGYLTLKFKRLGLDIGAWFEPDVWAAIHARLQDGGVSFAYPQRVNNLVVKVLNAFAEIGGMSKVPAELLEQV